MDFETYWKGLGAGGQEVFAISCGSTVGYLYLIALGHKPAGPKLAMKIERASGGKVKRARLRPDIWAAEAA